MQSNFDEHLLVTQYAEMTTEVTEQLVDIVNERQFNENHVTDAKDVFQTPN
jgi:hypothetical protein